jgi:transcription elongation factor Elf1
MFCTKCGKENSAGSCFCGYCGNALTSLVAQDSEMAESSKDEMDLAYYKANLKMQQQALLMQQRELEEMRRQTEQQRKQFALQKEQYDNMMKCPRCGSTSLSGNKKGYGIGKGLVGAALLGPVGLIAGNMGAKKVIVTCMSCGYKFKK